MRTTIWCALAAFAILVVLGVTLKDQLRGELYLHHLRTADEAQRKEAVAELASLGPETGAPFLVRALQIPSAEVAIEVQNALKAMEATGDAEFLSTAELGRLRSKHGASSSARDLLAQDLLRHTELIPFEGILGGTMGFFGPDNLWFLRGKQVVAYFEDGHVGGHMLLKYRITEDGQIVWKVIKAFLS